MANPAYNLVNLRALDWLPQSVTGLAWLGTDTLVVAEFGGVKPLEQYPIRKGALHLLTGVMKAKGPADVKRVTIAQGLAQPIGLAVKDGAIYVHEKGDLGTEIFKVSRVGNQWLHELYAKGWGADDGYMWHSFPGGLLFKDGMWQFNVSSMLGTGYRDAVFRQKIWPAVERGKWFSLDPVTKKYKVMASGMRTNTSTWLGPWGGLFTVDVQGDWEPDNKIIELKEGRFYGHIMGPDASPLAVSPPMCYMPQGEASNSPGEGVYLKKGPFKGQVLVTEQTYGGINRYSVERINGELQACVFDFGGTPRAPPFSGAHSQRILLGQNNETIFYGCAGGWWVSGPELGSLAKLEPNGRTGLEMLAIRNTGPTGFDIEFTLPVDAALAGQVGNYSVQTWTQVPTEHYGKGAKVGQRMLGVKSARVSDAAGRIVHLEFNPGELSTGTVKFDGAKLIGIGYTVSFELNALRSATGETLFDTRAFYTLNQFGPGTVPVPGCMLKGDPHFNPAANDPYADLCSGTVGTKPLLAAVPELGEARSEGRTLRIRFADQGPHALRIFDMAGKLVHQAVRLDGLDYSTRLGKPGIYLVRLESPAGAVTKEVSVP